MLERQREGITKAQQQGKYQGRAPTVRRRAAEIIRTKDAGVAPTEIASRLGIGRASVYRVLGVLVWAVTFRRRGTNDNAFVRITSISSLCGLNGGYDKITKPLSLPRQQAHAVNSW
jgi:hypothetical protein